MLASVLAVTIGDVGAAVTRGLGDSVNEFAERLVLEQAQRQGWLEPQLRLTPTAKPSSVPPCPSGWQIEALDTRYLSRLRFSAHCPDRAAAPHQVLLLRGQLSAEVLVAAQALRPGQLITESDVLLERRDITNAPEALSQFDAVLGQSPRTSLRPGQLLLRRQLQAALLIKRGQKVSIVARNGGIEVQAAGEALDAGALGAQIRVRNLASGRVISARVLDEAQVEPALR